MIKPSLFYDRVRESTTTSGTGTVTLLGAISGFQSFSVVGNASQVLYCIADQSGINWEVGLGTYTSSGTTLSRDTVLTSSNSGSAVSFSSSTKDVFATYPAFLANRTAYALFDHFADIASTNINGTEDDLYTDTLAANTLLTNGDKVTAEYCVTVVASATATRRIQAYFGGTNVLDSAAQTFTSAGTVEIWLSVIRESSTVARVKSEMIFAGLTLQPIVAYTRVTGLTLTNTQIIKITGIAAGTGAAASDIVAKIGFIVRTPAA